MIKTIGCIVILFLPLWVAAQKEGEARIDSLLAVLPKIKEDSAKVNLLNELSSTYQYVDPDKGLSYGNQSLKIAKKLQWKDGMASAYKNIGVNYFIISDFPRALQHYNKALQAHPSEKIKGDLFNNIGLIYAYQSDYAKGLEYAFRCLKIREAINDTKGMASSYSNIGMVYFNMGNSGTAIKYYEKSIQFNEKINNQLGLTRILLNLGNIYAESNEKAKAMACYEKGMKISEKLGDSLTQAKYLAAIANFYLDQQQYELALQYSAESMQLTEEKTADESNIAFCSGIMGAVYFEMATAKNNDPSLLEKANSCFTKALEIDKRLNHLKILSYEYEQLSTIATLKGNHKTALDFYKKAVVYKDSVFNADNKETIKNLEDQRTIDLRNKEIKISKLKLESKEKQKWYFIFGLGLLAIIVGLLFYQSNNRKKTNRKLNVMNNDLDQANKVKTRLLSILNHDLRSPVNSFIHFIQLQKENPELLDESTKNRIENATLSSAKNLLHSMEDILLWTKDQMENFEPQPKNIRIDSLFEDTENHFSAVENVRFSFECEKNLVVFTDDNYLKTIIRNLTGNAIHAVKESQDPIIVWKAWRENKQTILSVSDNGAGASEEQLRALYDDTEVAGIQSGLGLHLIRDLAKAIHCTIVVDSKLGRGTTFILSLD